MGEECCECHGHSNGLMVAVVKNNKDTHICIDCLAEDIHARAPSKK